MSSGQGWLRPAGSGLDRVVRGKAAGSSAMHNSRGGRSEQAVLRSAAAAVLIAACGVCRPVAALRAVRSSVSRPVAGARAKKRQ